MELRSCRGSNLKQEDSSASSKPKSNLLSQLGEAGAALSGWVHEVDDQVGATPRRCAQDGAH